MIAAQHNYCKPTLHELHHCADQAVMMVKEPDNAYDADAVAVQTLNGHCIGYVPREHTARFPHDVTFGHIYSFGPSSAGLWGVQVQLCSASKHIWRCCLLLQLG